MLRPLLLCCVLVQMAVALGGRIAEELIFGEDDITTGASGDFQQVTRTARLMVTQLGFSKKLGQVAWSSSGGNQFLGGSMAQPSDFSMKTADEVDAEVKQLVERAYRCVTDRIDFGVREGAGVWGLRTPLVVLGSCLEHGRLQYTCSTSPCHVLTYHLQHMLLTPPAACPLKITYSPAVLCRTCVSHTHNRPRRRAKDLIQENIDILHKTAAVLMEKENIDGDEFQQIVLESQAQQYLKQDAPGVTIPYQSA